jgi:Protein of unknown function (DUF1566)
MNGIARLLIVAGLVVSGLGAAQAQNNHYRDNGDGTVSDLNTTLMWEKKTGTVTVQRNGGGVVCHNSEDCPDVHDVNNMYQWTLGHGIRGERGEPDGNAFTGFLATLNGEVSRDGQTITGCFANHCDWRLPSIDELRTIFDTNVGPNDPTIDAIFGPTHQSVYWTATTWSESRAYAWALPFYPTLRGRFEANKARYFFVRAVRGGCGSSTP